MDTLVTHPGTDLYCDRLYEEDKRSPYRDNSGYDTERLAFQPEIRANLPRPRKGGFTMPGRGRLTVNGEGVDMSLEYTLGGYQVIKKWLS